MPAQKPARKKAAVAVKRRPGRPAKNTNPEVSRERITALAIELSKTVPLSELTMVRLAKELGVTHTLLHYYMAGRDEVTSLVLNHLYAQLFESIGEGDGDWRDQLETIAHNQRRILVAHAGATLHLAIHSRHRMLQGSDDPEADFGLRFNDRLFQIMRSIGFSKRDGATAAHLFATFVLFSALGEVTRALPEFHAESLARHINRLDPQRFPGMHWIAPALPTVSADEVFSTGLRYLLDGFAATIAAAKSRRTKGA
jgi:AcrR family transcriptional regulator